jgi:3-deoxy-D-manno-octulosonic-acid transferase
MTAARFLYTLLLFAALPFIALRLVWRALRQPAYLRHVGERFGWYGAEARRRVIWVHAVSVGETRAAQPLVEALLARYAGAQVLMTYMTPTGRETGENLFGERGLHAYLPYDYPATVARFLDHFRPRLGLIMETEIWFNLLAGCAARHIPVLLVNGRLSEKSAAGYLRIAGLARSALQSMAAVTAQSEADAERFRLLGAERVLLCGNLKFDITPDPVLVAQGMAWRAALPVLHQVLAVTNTREGEEALILDAFCAVPGERRSRVLLVVVPRHPQRFNDVAALIGRSGLKLARRSLNQFPSTDTQVWLGDSMGEMAAYYAMCDVALVGGSLLPFGAHNLIEACAQGKPVVIGPHTFNFAEATELAIAHEAALRVTDATMAMENALELLDDVAALRKRSEAASRFAAEHRGATEMTMALIAPLLDVK